MEGRWPDKAFGMRRVGDIESSLPVFTNSCGHAVMDYGGSHHADSGVAMVVVVPGEKGLTESATVLNAAEGIGKLWAIFHGAELAF